MNVEAAAHAARRAGRQIAGLDEAQRSALLRSLAARLDDDVVRGDLLVANSRDVEAALAASTRGELNPALVNRLVLTPEKLAGLADGLRQLADLPPVIGRRTLHRMLDEGLVLSRVSCPLGLLGVIFESRPDAVPQIAGLALKSGNAVLLKGGREAKESNRALVALVRDTLAQHHLDPQAVGYLEDRSDVDAMLRLRGIIDLIIARGSAAFVHHIQKTSEIPVLGHAEGLCHLYLHASAVPAMAARIAVDAKCSYPAACNAIETLLWEPGAEVALAACVRALADAGVELRACAATRALYPAMQTATDDDWRTEYGAPILAICQVPNIEGALAHIEAYGSRHTETIVAADAAAAERFLRDVDAAGVYHNASSRFADGYRYGLGAEVGISTDKLHARGPVGVEGLVTYRWLLRGDGHISANYGPGKKRFLHRDL